ncbi:unnamed protein product [Closterium sp. NIES-54]
MRRHFGTGICLPLSTIQPRASSLLAPFAASSTNASGWQLYHPATRQVLSSQDVTFDESVCLYRLFPHASSPVPPPPLFLVPGGDPTVGDTAASCHSPRLETPPGFPPRPSSPSLQPVTVGFVAAGGGGAGGVDSEGAHAEGAGSGGAEPEGAESGGAELGGDESRGVEPRGAETGGDEPRVPDAGSGGAGGARGTGARGIGAGGAGGIGAGSAAAGVAGGIGARGTGGSASGVLSLPSSTSTTPPLLCPSPDPSQTRLQPDSPVPAPSPYTKLIDSSTKCRGPVSRSASTVRIVRRVRPPPVPDTHTIALRPSSVPQHVALPSPPASPRPDVTDPEYDLARAASPTVTRCPSCRKDTLALTWVSCVDILAGR